MQFQLPSNLQNKLLQYDPKLKKLVSASDSSVRKTTKTGKPKYPFGKIPTLIPHHIVKESLQNDAIDNINSSELAYRYQEFTEAQQTKAILYYYQSCWYAAWLPREDEDYIFGFGYVFRNSIKVDLRPIEPELCKELFINKTSYSIYTQIVNNDNLGDLKKNMLNRGGLRSMRPWIAPDYNGYKKKCTNLSGIIFRFEQSLKSSIPIWLDSANMFERILCTEIYNCLDINSDLIPENKRVNWVLNLDNLLEAFSRRDEVYGRNSWRDSDYEHLVSCAYIFKKPFLKKWIDSQLAMATENYNNKECQNSRYVKKALERILRLAENVNIIYAIWPSCPVDYIQNNLYNLLSVSLVNSYMRNKENPAFDWLRTYMPCASFFKILNKYCEENGTKIHEDLNVEMNDSYKRFADWNDVVRMLQSIFEAGQTIQPPKRWRLKELHDHVQEEAWKITNPDEELPQDLFPEPVHVDIDGNKLVFMQPKTTHQLAAWGRAVRNCVGASTTYAQGVRKKKHFIVLCMVDNKPRFTIQLRLEMGSLSVEQIRDISNSALEPQQKQMYEKAFALALNKLA